MVSCEHHSLPLEFHPDESFANITVGEGREKEEKDDVRWEITGNGGRCVALEHE